MPSAKTYKTYAISLPPELKARAEARAARLGFGNSFSAYIARLLQDDLAEAALATAWEAEYRTCSLEKLTADATTFSVHPDPAFRAMGQRMWQIKEERERDASLVARSSYPEPPEQSFALNDAPAPNIPSAKRRSKP